MSQQKRKSSSILEGLTSYSKKIDPKDLMINRMLDRSSVLDRPKIDKRLSDVENFHRWYAEKKRDPEWKHDYQDSYAEYLKLLDEGMGASAGGGTPGSAGAGGSSLGLPYPSTYEKENNKFKKQGQERTVAMTTENSIMRGLYMSENKIYKRDELPQLNADNLKDSDFKIKSKIVDLDKLKPSQKERVSGLVKKTKKAIKEGLFKPIVIDCDHRIVNGHHRYDAYKELKFDKVPVLKVNATLEELIDKYMK